MSSPATALTIEHRHHKELRVRITLRSGVFVDGVALDGTEDALLIAESPTTTPVRIETGDITIVAVRERSRAREWMVAIGGIAAVPVFLIALLQLPFEISEDAFKWIIPAIILAGVGAAPRALQVPFIERTLHRWREVYRAP
jgi:hypothetical protein